MEKDQSQTEGITITSNRGGTIYKDRFGNEIDPPQDQVSQEKKETERIKKRDRDAGKE